MPWLWLLMSYSFVLVMKISLILLKVMILVESIQFDNFVDNATMQDSDLDNFILNSLGFVNPVLNYFYPSLYINSSVNFGDCFMTIYGQ